MPTPEWAFRAIQQIFCATVQNRPQFNPAFVSTTYNKSTFWSKAEDRGGHLGNKNHEDCQGYERFNEYYNGPPGSVPWQ